MVCIVTTALGSVTEVKSEMCPGIMELGLSPGDTYEPGNCSWFDDIVDVLDPFVPGEDEFVSVEARPSW